MLTPDQVSHLAKLARLDLTEDEKSKFAEQLSSVLFYFRQIDEADDSGVPVTVNFNDQLDIVRADKVKVVFSAEKTLAAAPEVEGNQIVVKAVFER
jgi:aspartyl-tRNA(Asn)/glutamyl-tRNA(Gln) amidotransferase subunit C